MGVEAIANFLSASANGQTNGRRSSALNCHRRLSFSFYIYPSHSVSACLSLEPKMMKSTKRQRQRQRRLNCKMLSSCWFLFFSSFFSPLLFLFWSLATLRFQPDSNAVVSSSSLSPSSLLALLLPSSRSPSADRRSSNENE